MIEPVYQQHFGADTGDCLLACIASITGIPLADFPPPVEMGDLKKFLASRHWFYFECDLGHYWLRQFQGIPIIASVPSQKLEGVEHAIIVTMRGSTLTQLHDPNPGNAAYHFGDTPPNKFAILVRTKGLPEPVPA
jgi:hypothetical protein